MAWKCVMRSGGFKAKVALAAIRAVNALASPDSSALLVLVNFHRFLNSTEIVQALVRQIGQGKQNRTFVLVLAPWCRSPWNWRNSLSSWSTICLAASNWKQSHAASPRKTARCRASRSWACCWMRPRA